MFFSDLYHTFLYYFIQFVLLLTLINHEISCALCIFYIFVSGISYFYSRFWWNYLFYLRVTSEVSCLRLALLYIFPVNVIFLYDHINIFMQLYIHHHNIVA